MSAYLPGAAISTMLTKNNKHEKSVCFKSACLSQGLVEILSIFKDIPDMGIQKYLTQVHINMIFCKLRQTFINTDQEHIKGKPGPKLTAHEL